MRLYLNRDWDFTEVFSERLFDGPWGTKQVTIPHTTKETPFHYFDESEYQMVSGYRKELFVPTDWEGKQILLTFEGVAHKCEVFLNGESIGQHHCGYTAFTVKLENLKYGEANVLVVRVDSREKLNVPPFGHVIDYMTYGGIYRDVYLEVKEATYFEDIFLHSDLQKLKAEVTLNMAPEGHICRISMGKRGSSDMIPLGQAPLKGIKTVVSAKVPEIELWDIDHPNLYDVKIELMNNDQVIDTKTIPFGFRNMEFRKDGFWLNGRKLKIRGLNRHQSYPYVGYAMPASMQKLDADIL